MREYKFRAWHKPTKTIQEVVEICFINKYVSTLGINDPIYLIPFDDIELMQFTGLHDKNGKGIYEGDIIEWSIWPNEIKTRIKDVVTFRNGAFSTDNRYQLLGTLEPHREFEIIGNIHEHPELLRED